MQRFYFADVVVHFVFLDQYHRFRFVVQFRTDMSVRIFSTFVLVEDGVQMYLSLVGPLHQLRYNIGRLTGRIDVVDQVAYAVYEDET